MNTTPTVPQVLAAVTQLVCSADATAEMKLEAIKIAYDIGVADGRCQGAKTMGDDLCSTLNKAVA